MPAEKPALQLAAQQAQARIAELEGELARLRRQANWVEAGSVHPPSFIVESITDAFVAVDREFRYVWVNSEAERLLGVPREQLLGRCLFEVFPDASGSPLEARFRQALAEQTPLDFENYHAPWDRWFHNKIYPTKEGGLSIFWKEISDRKRAQADLKRQALVVDQVHDSIIATDLEGRIIRWNRGAEKMFGYSSAEALGRHVSMLYFEEDREEVRSRILTPLMRDGQSEIELRNRRKCGEECFIHVSLSLLRDESGQPYGMLGVATDITGQRRAEQALRESEERYRCLVDAMPQVAFISEADGKTSLINRQWEKYAGVAADQCLGLNWLEWVHPEDMPAQAAGWMQCIASGEVFENENRLRNARGEYRWHLTRAVPVRGADGTIKQWVGTATDIHDRIEAGHVLARSEERFRLAFRAVSGMVYDWDPLTGVVHRSGNLEDVLGIPTDGAEPYAGWWQERVHPEDQHATVLNVVPSLPPGQNKFETEFRIRHADGHWVHVCDRGFIVRDSAGTAIRVVGSTHNVSERKRLERELDEHHKLLKLRADALASTNAQLARANEDLLHFAFAVSHDLEAPLRTAKTFSQMLARTQQAKLDDEGAKLLQWIIEACTRMSLMLNDLLQFAKVAGGEFRLSGAVSMEQALTTVLENLRGEIEETSAQVTSDPLPHVAGDAGQLAQLLQNLIGNALKYRKPDRRPQIHISAERGAEEWVITVADNGIGFKAQFAELIFGVFQRLHGDEFAGTGIGLTICKRIVERHGGRIWATAEPGEGAAFSFSIPIAQRY